MKNKVFSFRDENGNSVEYTVKEHILVNNNDYVIMSPTKNSSELEVFKFNFSNGNESLDLVESETELSMIKSASKIMN